MRRSAWRVLGLVMAVLAHALASGLPLHAHADHTSSVRHVEVAHGAHDLVVMQTDERQKADAPVAVLTDPRVVIETPAELTPLSVEIAPREPTGRPQLAQPPPPRAPPVLL